MNPVSRLATELGALFALQPPWEFARYLACVAAGAPEVLRERTLAPADARVVSNVTMQVNGEVLRIPVGRMTELLDGFDDTPTFGGLREMYASNVYLRAFRPGFRCEIVVDLGANRGLFSLLAVKAYGARIAVGVEPEAYFSPVAELLQQENDIPIGTMRREEALISSKPGQRKISIEALMKKHELQSIDFLKCDIEGGEFDLFLKAPGFLDKVGNIAMELHPDEGPCQQIVDLLQQLDFELRVTDQFGQPAGPRMPQYLYASRFEDLL